ncbi:hypothetical protein BDN72DRAFT_906821 [Pluteus cervinus]|uniref:Uncharacterized protein n=1 Tax=Pluteus cervinus TaxID=181527 RepID=A0ACD2ZXU5_9AGAR|nr:hypothetical protein BDN72DRAFT_906821 [Pluteus cervinus]
MSFPEPILPPELERITFILALEGQKEPAHPTNLLLVAKRVREWLIPVLYFKTIVRHSSQTYPLNTINPSQSIAQHGNHTKHLLLECRKSEGDDEDSANILRYCPNVQRLTIWGGNLGDVALSMLELKYVTHLSINKAHLDDAMNVIEDTVTAQTLLQTFLSKITHFENLGPIGENDLNGFKQFISLTHLCVSVVGVEGPVINHLVEMHPDVVVIILFSGQEGPVIDRMIRSMGLDVERDPDNEWRWATFVDEVLGSLRLSKRCKEQLVVFGCRDNVAAWQNGAMSREMCMWARADKVIRMRRNRVERSDFRWRYPYWTTIKSGIL